MKHLKKFNEEYMYTFNIFCFGHDLSLNKELNNKLSEFDFEFNTNINGRNWEINFPYHGGQVQGDCYSCIFGTQITDDDNNKNYIKEIKNAKESDYIDSYNQFLKILISELENYTNLDEYEEEIKKIIEELKIFLSENEPGFYSVEASS